MEDYYTILDRMKENYKSCTGFYPSDCSDTGIRLKAFAAELYDCLVYANWVKAQMFIETASGESLDMYAEQFGLSRRSGRRASGTVTFSMANAYGQDISIPKDYRVYNEEGRCYLTGYPITIPAGTLSGTVAVAAEDKGSEYNVGKGDVRLFSKKIAGIDNITNTEAITGGTDVESDEDFRKRLLKIAAFPANGCNEAYYTELALGVDGICSVKIVPNDNGAGTITVYAGGENEGASNEAVCNLQNVMDSKGELSVIITAQSATEVRLNISGTITVDRGYVASYVKTECEQAVSDFIKKLGVGNSISKNDIAEKIKSIEGVVNVTIDNPSSIPEIQESEIVVLSAISLKTVQEE